MKKRIPSFLAGILVASLVFSLGIGAMAATGQFTITVDPINVQVNGQVFQPKDVNGTDVPVFVYQGTTYAPLRALAEAYGLEVGYDATAKMATVSQPGTSTVPNTQPTKDYSDWNAEEEAAYQEFKSLWELRIINDGKNPYDDKIMVNFDYIADQTLSRLQAFVENNSKESIEEFCKRLGLEAHREYEANTFIYDTNPNDPNAPLVNVWWFWIDTFDGTSWELGYSNDGYDRIMRRLHEGQ